MRIDGFNIYTQDRPSRPSTAVTPYREVQREDEISEGADGISTSQGLEREAQTRQVPNGNSLQVYEEASLPQAAYTAQSYQQPMNSRAAQALASYGTTADMARSQDAEQILGLDLYA